MDTSPTKKTTKAPRKMTPRRVDQIQQLHRKASAKAAQRRDSYGQSMLREMATAGLTLGDMARALEAEGILTPRGNWWWSRQQVRMALRFALQGTEAALIKAYLPKVGIAKKVAEPLRPKRKGYGRRRVQSNVRGARQYHENQLPERQRIRSKIKRPE